MLLLANCVLNSFEGAGGITEELREGGSDAGLRPCAFKDNAIEDLNLIEIVALCLERTAAAGRRRSDNRVVVVGERESPAGSV